MPKNIILETQTSTFLDLVGNGKRYSIAPYQRDYSWTDEQWDDLWTDILQLMSNPKDRHYMGALVIEAQSDREFLVIDGQQRMATLSTLALAIIGQLHKLAAEGIEPEANKERAENLKTRFIGEKDPASLILSSKLSLNETDDGFFQDYLVAQRVPTNPRGLPKSNRQMWECFEWIRKRLAALPEVHRDGKRLAELLNETIARRLLFILIIVEDELNAYTVFETLNARGMELSSTDLLKNYLFSRVNAKSDLATLQRRWLSLISSVRQERFPEFLRYHLLCSEPQIRSARLFKIVRDRVKLPAEVFSLMESLEQRAELFSALTDESHEYWTDRPECRPLIRERILYKSQQSTPLMFAAWEKFSPVDFVPVLKLVNVVTFRFSTVSSLNTNELEPVYHHAAKGVLDGSVRTLPQVFDQLRSVYVDDERFRQNFTVFEASTSGRSKKLIKHVLCRIESELAGSHVDAESDPATIEHILPENPLTEWENSFNQRDMLLWTYRLGNLTLLEPKLNRDIGNASYGPKSEVYSTSRYAMTKKIAVDAPTEWTPQQAERRQKWMAERASHLWRSDFA
jgi:hypothetical protein